VHRRRQFCIPEKVSGEAVVQKVLEARGRPKPSESFLDRRDRMFQRVNQDDAHEVSRNDILDPTFAMIIAGFVDFVTAPIRRERSDVSAASYLSLGVVIVAETLGC
jgi:hypothetical protein